MPQVSKEEARVLDQIKADPALAKRFGLVGATEGKGEKPAPTAPGKPPQKGAKPRNHAEALFPHLVDDTDEDGN